MNDETNATPRVRLSGRYDLLERLGEGGMGVVHRAWDSNLKTVVVIKIPRANAPGKLFAERFAREVQSLVRLRHPHVVGILDVGEHQGAPFAVLQYLSGGSLKDRGARDFTGRPVPVAPSSLNGWLPEIAAALDFVHTQGFVHRDVKPDNILFDGHGHVYLSDFGIAKVLASFAASDADASLTNPGGLIGTIAYMAPEQMAGQRCDGRADQYALAVMVYELLAGKGPFANLTPVQVLARKVNGEIQPLNAANPALAKAVALVVQRGMSGDSAARFPTCTAFAKALLTACAEGTEPMTRPAAPTQALGPVSPPPPPPAPLSCVCGNAIPVTPALFGKPVTCYKCRHDYKVSLDGRRLISVVPGSAPVPARIPAPAPVAPAVRRPAPPPPAHPKRPTAPLSLDETAAPSAPPPHPPKPPALPARRRSKLPLLLAAVAVLSALAIGLAVYRFWPRSDSVTRDEVVTGTIEIDFKSRRDGATDEPDVYNVNLIVRTADETQVLYNGTIHRRPPTKGAKGASPGWLKFNITVTEQQLTSAGKPIEGKVKEVGKIAGLVPQSTDGLYAFDELKWTNALGATFSFAGKVQGKRGDDREKKATEVPVFVGGERMTYLVADADPMKFRGLVVPDDSALSLPAAELGGDLTFDYEKGSYLPNNLTFTSGKTADRVVGIINWDRNPADYLHDFKVGQFATNARSQYRFNLVFVPASAESGSGGARLGKDDEKRLTVTDKKMSTLTGSIDYVDEGPVRKEAADPEPSVLPHKSRLTFKLNANRLTPRQIHTFLRMWLLMSGPVNDE